MTFSTTIVVAFGDTDPAGLVYYPNLFHYCHIALERFFEEFCQIPYSELVLKERFGFPTVKINAEFIAPIQYGDVLEVRIRMGQLGNCSVTLEYSLRRTRDHTVCATIEQIHVAMNLDTQQSLPIPSYLRERFQQITTD